jgi:hypothetical protein
MTPKQPLHNAHPKGTLFVLIAYAHPLWSHLHMQTCGSPGYRPF